MASPFCLGYADKFLRIADAVVVPALMEVAGLQAGRQCLTAEGFERLQGADDVHQELGCFVGTLLFRLSKAATQQFVEHIQRKIGKLFFQP